MTTAEIIAIGTELLLGETTDTNTRYIARSLRGLGVNLFRTQVIGDNAERIAALMREALDRADFVITTGGLGPTVDDPTRDAAARAAGLFLEYHPELWEQIKTRIARYGRTPTENQKRQAFLPQFAIPIENPVGTAPAFILESGQKSLICLPGVPREMETLLEKAVIPYLQLRYKLDEVIQVRNLHVSGVGEGILDSRIGDLETLSNPTVGLTAHSGIVTIRITAKAGTRDQAEELITRIETDLRTRLGDDIFGSDDDTLEGIALSTAQKRGWRLSTLEYQTGGALKSRLGRIGNDTYLDGQILEAGPENLIDILKESLSKISTTAALGLVCSQDGNEQKATIALVTPDHCEERTLSYGGHPANLVRWSVNHALDLLRRVALKVG